ncbi:MAG: type II toxin-antitoxin system YafQ family toxin [Gallionellaceae bacterium]
MRRVDRTNQFKRDYKRVLKSQQRATPYEYFAEVAKLLAHDHLLPERFRDHTLTGEWKNFRDCHIKPDLKHFKGRIGRHKKTGAWPVRFLRMLMF